MIKTIRIKNFILIDNIEINLSPKLNIITGETGSGKSMLIEALLILFGSRASSEYVRKGASKAIIEAELTAINKKVISFLQSNEFDIYDNLIIRKEISIKGSNRSFINDTPVNLSQLKDLGDLLIDFHGQHEHQSLLNSMNHLSVLDNASDYNQSLLEYKYPFNKLKDINSELNTLIKMESDLNHKLSYRHFVYDEIIKVNPIEKEDEKIEKELSLLENSEQILSYANDIYEALYGSDNSIFNDFSDIINKIEKLSQFNLEVNEQLNEIISAKIITKEVASTIKAIAENSEFSNEKIEELRLRFSQLKGLRRKYGTISEILKLKLEIEEENQFIENNAAKINELQMSLQELQIKVGQLSVILSQLREKSASNIASKIIESLNNMGIKYVDFQTKFFRKKLDKNDNKKLSCVINDEFYECNENGIDNIEFYITTNKGQEIAPLSIVASGGEISRIMLALKKITSDNDIIDTMVFDEIDTGISGRIAQMVGSIMNQIASKKQIIAITHLPQIAAFGDKNFAIRKSEDDSIEVSRAFELDNDEKLNEIAKMISGENITENSIKSALELINFAKD